MNLRFKVVFGVVSIVFGTFVSMFNVNAERNWLHNFVEQAGDTVTEKDYNRIFREKFAAWERDEEGNTPLDIALQHGKRKKYETIMYASIADMRRKIVSDMDARSDVDQQYLYEYFFCACQNRCALDIVQALRLGADPKLPIDRGLTPLHVLAVGNIFGSCLMGDGFSIQIPLKRVVDIMVNEYGADVNAVDGEGRTPLHMVSNREVAEKLVELGADINAMDNEGCTPLDILCFTYECYRTSNDPKLLRLQTKIVSVIWYLINHGARFSQYSANLERNISEASLFWPSFISF